MGVGLGGVCRKVCLALWLAKATVACALDMRKHWQSAGALLLRVLRSEGSCDLEGFCRCESVRVIIQ